MSKIITYKARNPIEVGIPFTWGERHVWAIKVDDGDMYYLETGKPVKVSEGEILSDRMVYASRIEIE